MTTPKHAQAPWIIHDFISDNIHRINSDNVCICDVYNSGDDELAISNANIIAAAPELLDALIKITDVVDAELHDVLPTHEYKAEVMQQARAVIEKATK